MKVNDTASKKLHCPDCGTTDGKYIVSVDADGALRFQCARCPDERWRGVIAGNDSNVSAIVAMLDRYEMLG